jgi:hypothetical protein
MRCSGWPQLTKITVMFSDPIRACAISQRGGLPTIQ